MPAAARGARALVLAEGTRATENTLALLLRRAGACAPRCPQLGGGRTTLSLYDVMPARCVEDLTKLAQKAAGVLHARPAANPQAFASLPILPKWVLRAALDFHAYAAKCMFRLRYRDRAVFGSAACSSPQYRTKRALTRK